MRGWGERWTEEEDGGRRGEWWMAVRTTRGERVCSGEEEGAGQAAVNIHFEGRGDIRF